MKDAWKTTKQTGFLFMLIGGVYKAYKYQRYAINTMILSIKNILGLLSTNLVHQSTIDKSTNVINSFDVLLFNGIAIS